MKRDFMEVKKVVGSRAERALDHPRHFDFRTKYEILKPKKLIAVATKILIP